MFAIGRHHWQAPDMREEPSTADISIVKVDGFSTQVLLKNGEDATDWIRKALGGLLEVDYVIAFDQPGNGIVGKNGMEITDSNVSINGGKVWIIGSDGEKAKVHVRLEVFTQYRQQKLYQFDKLIYPEEIPATREALKQVRLNVE